MLTPADMLATLKAMTADLPHRPDVRGQDEVDHEAALDQMAEYRAAARREPTSDRDAEWLAERCERAWQR